MNFVVLVPPTSAEPGPIATPSPVPAGWGVGGFLGGKPSLSARTDGRGSRSRSLLASALLPHRYADRAKSIKNTPKINESPKDALLRKMQEEIEALRKQLGGDGMADDSSEEDSSSEEEVTNWDGSVTRKKKMQKSGEKKPRMSASTMAAKKDAFEQEMKALQA